MNRLGTAKYIILQLLGVHPITGKNVWGFGGSANDMRSAEQVRDTFPKGEATIVEREKLERNSKIKKGGKQ